MLRAVRDDDCERSQARSFPRASVNAGRQIAISSRLKLTHRRPLLVKLESFPKLATLAVNVFATVSVFVVLQKDSCRLLQIMKNFVIFSFWNVKEIPEFYYTMLFNILRFYFCLGELLLII